MESSGIAGRQWVSQNTLPHANPSIKGEATETRVTNTGALPLVGQTIPRPSAPARLAFEPTLVDIHEDAGCENAGSVEAAEAVLVLNSR
jgi:hypothetical protein